VTRARTTGTNGRAGGRSDASHSVFKGPRRAAHDDAGNSFLKGRRKAAHRARHSGVGGHLRKTVLSGRGREEGEGAQRCGGGVRETSQERLPQPRGTMSSLACLATRRRAHWPTGGSGPRLDRARCRLGREFRVAARPAQSSILITSTGGIAVERLARGALRSGLGTPEAQAAAVSSLRSPLTSGL